MITAGTIDTSIFFGGGFNGNLVYTTVIQPDGKILVGGNFTDYDGNSSNYLTRLETNGNIDTSFVPSLLGDYVRAIALESDGKILVGGAFSDYNSIPTQSLVRFNTDGTLATVFTNGFTCNSCNINPYEGPPIVVRAITIQPDGKILVGGWFDTYNGTNTNYIVRLNYDGTIDTTFNIGTGFDNQVFSIVVLPNGNILVGGDFNSYNGITSNGIALLSTTGSLLNSFGSGFDGRVQKIVVQSDGKILLGGQFTDFNGTNSPYLIRLTSSGLIDTTFNFDSWVINILLQNDGRIIVVGQFNNVNSIPQNYITRLNPSGSLDGSFIQGSGFDNYVNAVSLLNSGSILLGGYFSDYDGVSYNKIIALNNDESTYQYQYVYSAQTCDLTLGLGTPDNLPIVIVGSDIELTSGQVISVSDINSPSLIQCAEIISDFNIAAEPTHFYKETYQSCGECLSANTLIALVNPCSFPTEPLEIPIVVSNLYQVGDIISIPPFISSSGDTVLIYNDCFVIQELVPYENFPFPLSQVVVYQPQQSCEYCTTCNGRYYEYGDCTAEEGGVFLSHQNIPNFSTILFQSGSSNCKQVFTIPSILLSYSDYTSFFSGCPVINSTVIFSGGCDECLYGWSTYEANGGFVEFNPSFEGPPSWLISGPEQETSCSSEGGSLTYIYYYFPTSGSLTFDFYWDATDVDGVDYDWPFYWVSNNKPNGFDNIDYTTNQISNINTDFGTITIDYPAGSWVTIGVYSVDCVQGPGLLYITPLFLNQYSLHEFTTCEGQNAFVNVSQESTLVDVTQITYTNISTEDLSLMPEPGEFDDDFIEIPFPTDFSANFLCSSYDKVYMSTNGYITFGGGNFYCCFQIPNQIPSTIGLPGVYISTNDMGINNNCTDTWLFEWYSGLTNSGNNFVIKFVGSYYGPVEEDECVTCPPFVYSFVFYKNEPNYFDLVIESNNAFCNDNPTGGVSNGVDFNFLGTFDSSSRKSYRITSTCLLKANVGEFPSVCGTVGQSVTAITQSVGSGSTDLYYSDTNQTYDSCEECGQKYGVIIRECVTGVLYYGSMFLTDIETVYSSGPIFAISGVDCYEILDYCVVPNQVSWTPKYFYNSCASCQQPFSAGTPYEVCDICNDCSGTTITQLNVPHPIWTRPDGKPVVIMDAVRLGGMFGLNN